MLERVYYIERPKILLKYTFFQEQSLVFSRDNVNAGVDIVLRQKSMGSSEHRSAQLPGVRMASTR